MGLFNSNDEYKIKKVNEQLAENENYILSKSINVKMPFHGLTPAKGDDVTDDTVAIQSIINYAIDNNLSVYIPSGTYKVTELFVDKYIHLYGDSEVRTVLHYVGTGTCLKIGDNLLSSERIRVYLHDFKITGDVIDDITLRSSLTGIQISKTSGSFFERIRIEYFKDSGFKIWGKDDDPSTPGNSVFNNIYHKVTINRCKNGFDIKGIISDSYFSEGQMNYIEDYGFYFHTYFNPSYNVNIHKYTCVVSKKCVFVDSIILRNLTIGGCNFEQFSEHGVLINGYNPDKCYVGTIANNLFLSKNLGTEIGIDLNYVDSFNVNANVFVKSLLSDITVRTTSGRSTVFGNMAIGRSPLVTVSSTTSTYFAYAWSANQDITRFERGVGIKQGDFVSEGVGKGVILKTPDGTSSYRISVDNTGAIISTLI